MRNNNWYALDCETTGLDIYHGARPYMVTTCDTAGEQNIWRWQVNPKTRKVIIPKNDLRDIADLVMGADGLVLQNAKFDVAALREAGLPCKWPWNKTHDTLIAGHLLASNQPHDLTTMVMVYLHHNMQPYEDRMQECCKEALALVKEKYPNWLVAKVGIEGMPSARGSMWKYDTWLPKQLATLEEYDDEHPWHHVTEKYALADSAATLNLFRVQRQLLVKRKLWLIYKERLKVLPVACEMEEYGITVSKKRLNELGSLYRDESDKAGRICVRIAAKHNYGLVLPKTANNKSLLDFAFGPLGLPHVKKTPKGKPSLDKWAMDTYIAELDDGPQKDFVLALRDKRKRDTALSYMEGYRKFWIPEGGVWHRLHPSLNPTGTDTLRWSSSNPNEQNISKQEGFNLRYCFGPKPGREWWSCDAQNIELRIPAFEAGEEEMIYLFTHPDEPPYFGSYHMLLFATLHPDKFKKHGMNSKKVYASTWYQWTKNGNFAVQYGAMESSGTADRAYHVKGAQKLIQSRFKKISALNAKMIAFARDHGYVETMPDLSVDPDHGYPLLCTRTAYGQILPTVPLNYHVQGTACWWMMKAMVRVHNYLKTLDGDYRIVMQVHDEMVFDFPRKPANRKVIEEVMRLMAMGGDDLGIPTPVSCVYHPRNWGEGDPL